MLMIVVLCIVSESSLFIAKNRFILKTCGKTTLLAAVGPVLELVREKCGFDIIIVSSTNLPLYHALLILQTVVVVPCLINICVHQSQALRLNLNVGHPKTFELCSRDCTRLWVFEVANDWSHDCTSLPTIPLRYSELPMGLDHAGNSFALHTMM